MTLGLLNCKTISTQIYPIPKLMREGVEMVNEGPHQRFSRGLIYLSHTRP